MCWKVSLTLLVAAVFAAAALGQQPEAARAAQPAQAGIAAPLPAVAPAGRPAVGLALEGGGALGLAHIGVLEWLEQHHIPVDRISGTSMGSLVGGLYASGVAPAQIRAIAESDAFTSVFTLQTPYADASFRRRQDRHELPQAITVGLKHGLQVRNALFSTAGVDQFLVTNMAAYNRQNLDFNQLPIPFRCVATDLNTQVPVTFAGGPLPAAIRASISIPGIFPPVQAANGHYLVDGGIMDNLPTGALKHELGAGVVIAVYLDSGTAAGVDTSSIVSVLNRAFSAGVELNVTHSRKLADVVIAVPVGGFSGADYAKAAQLIAAGRDAADRSSAALLPYALSDLDWQAYLADRQARGAAQPGPLRQVRVNGGAPGAIREVMADMKTLEGKPVTAASTFTALKGIQSNGGYSASWELSDPTSSTVPGAGILVRLSKDHTGPPYLLVAPELAAATSNISRQEISFRLVDQNLGGFGSELRAQARLGYMTDLSAEYYRLLTPGGYFVEPTAHIVREPVYIWADQKRIAERFNERLEAGLVVGRTFNNHLQISADWRGQDMRWSLRTGADGGGYQTGTAQTGMLRISLDQAASGAVSPNGFRLTAAAGAFYHGVASSNAPVIKLSFSRTRPWHDKNIFGIATEVNSYLRANVAQPYRFTLGGPLRLSAASFDEFRGTDTALARAGYMHRIAALPTGLGQGLYAVVGYEAGEIWSPESRAILRQDGITGLLANTPIGIFTFGVSVGDVGHRKAFVTLGRWF